MMGGEVQRKVRLVSQLDSPDCISLPIRVEGVRTVAVIDTGANVTCISMRMAKALQLMIVTADPGDRPIQLAHSKAVVKRIGATVPVTLDISTKKVIHPCEVLEMPEGYDLLIGMDTFYAFGFGITGLPGLHEGVEQLAPLPVEDERSALAPLVTPPEEETPEYQALKKVFMEYIRPILEENKVIPRDSFCTIPESKVYLRTPPGVVAVDLGWQEGSQGQQNGFPSVLGS
ncbi:hypothetical protein B0O80DRAFT_441245 [Mortierella sp. GBAus27b]|nr:hypothetical protein B0O80DRAFT_441245 [Mortierella sp. GBAus27b]